MAKAVLLFSYISAAPWARPSTHAQAEARGSLLEKAETKPHPSLQQRECPSHKERGKASSGQRILPPHTRSFGRGKTSAQTHALARPQLQLGQAHPVVHQKHEFFRDKGTDLRWRRNFPQVRLTAVFTFLCSMGCGSPRHSSSTQWLAIVGAWALVAARALPGQHHSPSPTGAELPLTCTGWKALRKTWSDFGIPEAVGSLPRLSLQRQAAPDTLHPCVQTWEPWPRLHETVTLSYLGLSTEHFHSLLDEKAEQTIAIYWFKPN